ncbi:hypothetical protein SD37_10670 [Amycolatopsis orientalis]|uniref:Uncharacterized protein n=1 Tax=Amycolatopsis orientalis TaxID=31958 RepID=A0A193BV61_AMYOR|nr:hypothetical protein SD37_10670 [Amycolatopsis orientalis]
MLELQVAEPPVHAFPTGHRIDEVQPDPGVIVEAPQQFPHVFGLREVADLSVHGEAHHLEQALPQRLRPLGQPYRLERVLASFARDQHHRP